MMALLSQMLNAVFSNDYLANTLQIATFLLFTAVGVILARRSGVFFLAADGVLSLSATAAFLSNAGIRGLVLGNAQEGTAEYEQLIGRANALGWLIGMLFGLIVGMTGTLILCWFLLRAKTNTLVTGILFNLFAMTACGMALHLIHREDGLIASGTAASFPALKIDAVAKIPVLGGLFGSTNLLTYLAVAAVFGAFYLLNRTGFGLRLRAAEENGAALIGTGISVERTRFLGMLFAGAAVSLGGIALSLASTSPTLSVQPHGEAYLALVAVWACDGRLWKSSIAVFMLSLVGALSVIWSDFPIPASLVEMLLYAAALGGLWIHAQNLKRRGKRRLRRQRRIVEGEQPTEKRKGRLFSRHHSKKAKD